MSLFLIAPDRRRLLDLFLFNRPAAPARLRQLFQRPWLNGSVVALRTVLVLAFVYLTLSRAYGYRSSYGEQNRPPLYGIWEVEEFETDGKVRPALVTDAQRWRRVIFDYPGRIAIHLMSDSRRRYALKLDSEKHTLNLSQDDPKWQAAFSYRQPEPDLLVLEGSADGLKIRARLRLAHERQFLLKDRGFHWINEYPFNR
jgi:hypothetical protein